MNEDTTPWERAGLSALTGREDGAPLGPPSALSRVLDELGEEIESTCKRLGRNVTLDPYRILAERAGHAPARHRRGATSIGGATELIRADDGWIAVTLSRPDDLLLLDAWVGVNPRCDRADAFAQLRRAFDGRAAAPLVELGSLLGLAVSQVGEAHRTRPPVIVDPSTLAEGRSRGALGGVVVIDLSSLWAGPLCSRILADAGATVIKVESTERPDPSRDAAPSFFDRLNAGKRSVSIPFTTSVGRRDLRALLEAADVVIEGSRPRALRQLGIDAAAISREHGSLWVSITAYGRAEPVEYRIGFGDDAAAAGGAVLFDGQGPVLCADAIADPLAGLHAGCAALRMLADGWSGLVDVALASCAAAIVDHFPEPAVPALAEHRPQPLAAEAPARPLGADTRSVLDTLR